MMVNLIRKQSPARIIAFGFIFVIISRVSAFVFAV